jgi:hypothetical protein
MLSDLQAFSWHRDVSLRNAENDEVVSVVDDNRIPRAPP